MVEDDVQQVSLLLNEYLLKFKFAPVLSEEEVRHWLMPLNNVVYSYVVKEGDVITDFISFYSLPSSVSGNALHTHLNAAYLFYYAPKGMGSDKERKTALIQDALVESKNVRMNANLGWF